MHALQARSRRAARRAAAHAALLLLLLQVLAHGAAAQAPACTLSSTSVCYADAPVRPVSFLADAADAKLTAAGCGDICAATGFPVVALTSNPSPAAYCYCGAAIAPQSVIAPASNCSLACPGGGAGACGAPGFSSVYTLTCSGPLPPAPVGPPLAPGRACSQPEVRGLPFCNASLPRSARVADLVGRFSMPELASQLQARSSSAVPRLGLPPFYWGSNNLHGISGSNCRAKTGRCPVSWPDGVAMTSSFNETAWQLLGAVSGVELRALYNVVAANSSNPNIGLTSWGPTINVLRDLRWGRSQESSSESALVSGRYGAAISRGLQAGADPRYLLAVAGLKHFAAYSLEQYGPPSNPQQWMRQTFNAVVSSFDAADTYFLPFKMAIQEGGAAGVMYAANEFNGVPCCASSYLDGVLHSWGFDGYRCTDGGQIVNIVDGHHYVPTLDQAIQLAAAAESDIADGQDYSSGGLLHAYINGNISEAAARNLLTNALTIRFRLGLFDDPAGQPYEAYGDADIGAPENWAAATLASREALVLLENRNGTLPLAPGARWARAGALAVIGPHANDTLTLQGNYGGAYCPNGPHGAITDCLPSIFTALSTHYAPGAALALGSGISTADPVALAAAVAAARAADAVVLVLGLDQTLEREQLDRYNITLPDAQQALFDAVADAVAGTATRIVVVLIHGGALAIPGIAARADAVLDGLYPGVTAGVPIADALFGAFSPGGKLPYTVPPPEYAQQYNFTNMSIAAPQQYIDDNGEAAMSPGGRTYRYYKGVPIWPFGYGLSYTNFSLAWGAAPPPAAGATLTPAAPFLNFSVALDNVGARDGDEVVQVYVAPVPGSFGAAEPQFLPITSIAGFSRRSLAAGARADIAFSLTADEAFALTQADGSRGPTNGRFTLVVNRGPRQAGELTLGVTLAGF